MKRCWTLPTCHKPSLWWRRQGAVWCCPICGTLWTVILRPDSQGGYRDWVRVDVVKEREPQ